MRRTAIFLQFDQKMRYPTVHLNIRLLTQFVGFLLLFKKSLFTLKQGFNKCRPYFSDSNIPETINYDIKVIWLNSTNNIDLPGSVRLEYTTGNSLWHAVADPVLMGTDKILKRWHHCHNST